MINFYVSEVQKGIDVENRTFTAVKLVHWGTRKLKTVILVDGNYQSANFFINFILQKVSGAKIILVSMKITMVFFVLKSNQNLKGYIALYYQQFWTFLNFIEQYLKNYRRKTSSDNFCCRDTVL